jgi:hypothetical protein
VDYFAPQQPPISVWNDLVGALGLEGGPHRRHRHRSSFANLIACGMVNGDRNRAIELIEEARRRTSDLAQRWHELLEVLTRLP